MTLLSIGNVPAYWSACAHDNALGQRWQTLAKIAKLSLAFAAH
jgi:hypothetical protein